MARSWTKSHLHEVGALDSLADVVGCAAALDALGLLEPRARVVVGSVALGTGTVATSHGPLPVPVPAVLAILAGRGASVVAGGNGELCTPTGAALLATLADEWGPLPAMRIDAVGVGAGTADPPERANVLRVVIGTAIAPAAAPWRSDDLFELEATVDDLDPRLWPAVLDALVEAGAVDAWLTPVRHAQGPAGERRDSAGRRPVDRRGDSRALHRVDHAGRSPDGRRPPGPAARRGRRPGRWLSRSASNAAFSTASRSRPRRNTRDAALAAERLGIPVRAVLDRAAALARGAGQSGTRDARAGSRSDRKEARP